MSGSHPVYGTNSLLTVLLVLVEKILIQHPPGNAKINYINKSLGGLQCLGGKVHSKSHLVPWNPSDSPMSGANRTLVSESWIFHVTHT